MARCGEAKINQTKKYILARQRMNSSSFGIVVEVSCWTSEEGGSSDITADPIIAHVENIRPIPTK
jgi:hypothetical protein